MLSLQDVHTFYGDNHILKGVSFKIEEGELATLLGRNGAGKSTTLKSIMGLAPSRKGQILFNETEISRLKPHQIAWLGLGYVPEERAIFPSLTVAENLTLPAQKKGRSLWNLEKIYQNFPVLKSRTGNKGFQLSGGEQQMLAIARILGMDLKFILLDEPTEGLAPFLVREIGRISQEIKKTDITILLVEQNTKFAMQMADRHYILYEGKIVHQATNEEFKADKEAQTRYLAV